MNKKHFEVFSKKTYISESMFFYGTGKGAPEEGWIPPRPGVYGGLIATTEKEKMISYFGKFTAPLAIN